MKNLFKDYHSKHFVGGQWIDGLSDETLLVKDKFTGHVLKEFSLFGKNQNEELINSSQNGFKELSNMPVEERSLLLKKCSKFIANFQKSFVDTIVKEAGKPISYAKAEVERAIFNFNWCSEEILRYEGEVVPINVSGVRNRTAITKPFPVGPVIGISPFNFPLNLAVHKIAPALACGCSITIKPSPFAPISCFLMGLMAQEVGIPNGGLNIVLGDIESSEELVRSDHFKLFSFTGSPQVGWHLKSIAGKKKVLLELGGNAPIIIDKDTNIEEIIDQIVKGLFLYAGQICISTQRIIVLGDIYEEFVQLLVNKTKSLIVGDPSHEETVVGPLIAPMHLERVHNWVSEAIDNGATLLCGGHIKDKNSNLYGPTLLTNVSPEMKVQCEEVFGPVGVIIKANSFEQAIELANSSKFGLQAGVFTNNIANMNSAFNKLEYAGVLINSIPGFRVDNMPYGGIKDSGLGREGAKYAFQDYTESKLLVF